MNDGLVSALVALVGTMFGTFGGIVTSGKLTNYRIEQLEKKVDAHNSFATKIPLIEERVKAMQNKITELEERGLTHENFKMDNFKNRYDDFGDN